MMDMLPSVVLYGHDPNLLETRRLVLQSAGIQAWTTASFEEAERLTATQPTGVLVLCYSLSVEECEQALAMIHSQPGRKCLVLSGATSPVALRNGDRSFSSFDGPRALVVAIDKLVKANNPTADCSSCELFGKEHWPNSTLIRR